MLWKDILGLEAFAIFLSNWLLFKKDQYNCKRIILLFAKISN